MFDSEVKERTRHASFRRILTVLELLREHRFGLLIEAVHSAAKERLGDDWHLRTTRRDLYFLREMRLADFVADGTKHRWYAVTTKRPI